MCVCVWGCLNPCWLTLFFIRSPSKFPVTFRKSVSSSPDHAPSNWFPLKQVRRCSTMEAFVSASLCCKALVRRLKCKPKKKLNIRFSWALKAGHPFWYRSNQLSWRRFACFHVTWVWIFGHLIAVVRCGSVNGPCDLMFCWVFFFLAVSTEELRHPRF